MVEAAWNAVFGAGVESVGRRSGKGGEQRWTGAAWRGLKSGRTDSSRVGAWPAAGPVAVAERRGCWRDSAALTTIQSADRHTHTRAIPSQCC